MQNDPFVRRARPPFIWCVCVYICVRTEIYIFIKEKRKKEKENSYLLVFGAVLKLFIMSVYMWVTFVSLLLLNAGGECFKFWGKYAFFLPLFIPPALPCVQLGVCRCYFPLHWAFCFVSWFHLQSVWLEAQRCAPDGRRRSADTLRVCAAPAPLPGVGTIPFPVRSYCRYRMVAHLILFFNCFLSFFFFFLNGFATMEMS